jgi:hypothetical protein
MIRRRQQRGKGVLDYIKRIPLALSGPRSGIPPPVRSFIQTYGNQQITDVRIGQSPVISGVQSFMNVISFGKFKKKQRNLGYDNIYHRFLIIKLANGQLFRIDKNQVVQIGSVSIDEFNKAIPLSLANANNLTVASLFDNASRNDPKFWMYNPADKNCQIFVKDIATRNNLQPMDINSVKALQTQNSKELVNTLGVMREVPKFITNVAGATDRIIHGDGFRAYFQVPPQHSFHSL